MGEFRPPIRSDFDRNAGEKWVECHLCGAKRTKVLVHFYSGRVAPVVGEKITGLTSLDTCIVEGYTLISGTFAGGDAVGVIEGNTPTGYDDNNLEIFHKDEELDGNIGGVNIANATNHGAVQISGRLIPDSEIVEYQGLNYCRPHFLFKFAHEWKDDTKIDTATEGDRE